MQCLEHLYIVANFNLRDFLALADEFSCHVMDTSSKLAEEDQKSGIYDNWLHTASTQRYQALKTFLTQSEWSILDVAMSDELQGTFGVSQFDVFNKNTSRALAASTFKKQLTKLKKHNLITRSIENDDDNTPVDESREVYAVTSQGALVHYARVRSRETQSYASIDWLKRVHR